MALSEFSRGSVRRWFTSWLRHADPDGTFEEDDLNELIGRAANDSGVVSGAATLLDTAGVVLPQLPQLDSTGSVAWRTNSYTGRNEPYHNGFVNVRDIGLSGSTANTQCSCTSGSPNITLVSASDFRNGDYVRIPHGGAASGLATPSIASATPVGATGATAFEYAVEAINTTLGTSAKSATVTVANSANLTTINAFPKNLYAALVQYNRIEINPVAGAYRYAVYRKSGSLYTFLGTANHMELTSSNDISDAAWTKVGCTTPDPSTMTENSAAGAHYIEQVMPPGCERLQPLIMRCRITPAARTRYYIEANRSTVEATTSRVFFDLTGGGTVESITSGLMHHSRSGQVASFATATITCKAAGQAAHYSAGDVLRLVQFASGSYELGNMRAGKVTVLSVDTGANTITCTGNITAGIASAANDDWIVREKDIARVTALGGGVYQIEFIHWRWGQGWFRIGATTADGVTSYTGGGGIAGTITNIDVIPVFHHTGLSSTAPAGLETNTGTATAQASWHKARIVSGGGTTSVVLDVAPQVTGSGFRIFHDDSVPWQADITASSSPGINKGRRYYVPKPPAGGYRLWDTLELNRAVFIDGEAASTSYPSTQLICCGWRSGIRVAAASTSSDGGAGSFSELRNLHLTASGPAPGAHGVVVDAQALLHGITVNGFGGDGYNMLANAPNNSNLSLLAGCWATNCGRHGLNVSGGDANAVKVSQFSAVFNLAHGVFESSFLGNEYTACHVASNYGADYYIDPCEGSNGSQFNNCYSESGQLPARITFPAMWRGGLKGNDAISGKQFTDDCTGDIVLNRLEHFPFTVASPLASMQVTLGVHSAAAGDKYMAISCERDNNSVPLELRYGLGPASDRWAWGFQNLFAGAHIIDHAKRPYVGAWVFTNGLFIGNASTINNVVETTYRGIYLSNGKPSSTRYVAYDQGDTIIDTASPRVWRATQKCGFGAPWDDNSTYRTGQVVRPTVPDGFVYVVTANGLSGATEPTWTSGTFTHGSLTYERWGVDLASVAALQEVGTTMRVLSSQSPGTVAAGSVWKSADITVTGAVVGDKALVSGPVALSEDLTATARVTATDTVRVYLTNPTAAGVAVTAGSVFDITVLKTQLVGP